MSTICSTRFQSKRTRFNEGYVTVFFTISIAIIMSLFIGMFYSARENAIRMRTVTVADTAMTSIFAEYNKQLWEQYGLVFVDSSYMTDSTGMKLTEDHLKAIINRNFDECRLELIGGKDLLKLNCTETEAMAVCLATDQKYKAIKHQAVNLMKYHYKIAYIDRAREWTGVVNEHNLSGGAQYDEAFRAADDLNSKYGIDYSGWLPSITGGNDISEDNIAGFGILSWITDLGKISTTKINKDNYASKRQLNKGNLERDYDEEISDYFFLREYMMHKCGNYLRNKPDSVLTYQTEYLVTGKGSDSDNLAGVARRIMVLREAANMITLTSDSGKMETIDGICAAIAAALTVPEAADILKAIVIAFWVNYESLTDMNVIFAGGKIPLIKTSDQWITDLNSALYGGNNADSSDDGLSYEDYLRIFVYMTGEEKLLMRLSDIIEMDIRSTPGNEYFRLDNCFDAWEAQIYVTSKHGYDFTAVRRRYVFN